ncbi:MAG: hypothetical protein QW196_02890 [Sulfolobales archaeon]
MSQVQVQETQTQEIQKEIFVPARVLDIIRSFVDSSTKCEYYWNSPPYRKILRDGSYWEVYKLEDEICVRAVSWTSSAEFCTDTVKLRIHVSTTRSFSEFTVEDARVSDAVLVSKCREFKIRLFEVLRKLYFYRWLM